MSLYVIGDLHLCFSDPSKTMSVFAGWDDYQERIERNWLAAVQPEDTIVLAGDISWGMSLQQAEPDFRFINGLPGRKVILKGNHDYWWSTANKAYTFFKENGISTIEILHNNFIPYGDAALCGTRGWFYEEEKGTAHDKKVMTREILRLEASLKAAGEREKLVFLHYPPKYRSYECPEILELLQKYSVRECRYGHLHGMSCPLAFEGSLGGTRFSLVSADYLDFRPELVRA